MRQEIMAVSSDILGYNEPHYIATAVALAGPYANNLHLTPVGKPH